MTTLFDATLQLANKLGVLRVSTATGGDTTSCLDTERTEANDTFNGGPFWLITDAGAASDAPEGEWAVVSGFANTGGDITISALTVGVAIGDTYGVAVGRYPLDVLKSAINNEIIKHKQVRYDRTSLDIIANTSEYTLPSGIRGDNLVNVYEETDTNTSDSQPTPLNFSVQEAATGSQHLLLIESRNVTPGYDIVLEYMARLSPLYLATDVVDEVVPMARILPEAAANAELIRMRTHDSGSQLDISMLRFYQEEANLARQENQIRRPAKRGRVNEAAGD
ncbi:hypothetical protein KAR91_17630 [Candidatus Pacearchaeota archaeon]|nr:hypothetical protein [Candidatus Pacearchaeota archaeon]